MEQSINNSIAHCGVARVVGEMEWTDEETKKLFTDSDGRVHSVAFIDPDSGERHFGGWKR